MLRKIGALALGLVCLIGVSSIAFSADEPAEQAGPSIGELEAFAGNAEAAAPADVDAAIADAEAKLAEGKPHLAKATVVGLLEGELTDAQRARVGEVAKAADEAIAAEAREAAPRKVVEVAPDLASKADQLLAEYVRKLQVEEQKKKAQAAEYAAEAQHLLYVENKPKEAYELARRALILDPASGKADDLKTEAGLQLMDPAEAKKFKADTGMALPPIRKQAALQALSNTIVSARELYAEGDYEEAIKRLRRANSNISALSVYMDMGREQRQVESLLARVQADYEVALDDLAATEKVEARVKAGEQIKGITETKRKEQARRFDEVVKLMEEANFEEARRVIDDMNYQDPADELVPTLLQRLSDEKNEYVMDRINAARVRGDVRLDQWESEMEPVPEEVFNYPDKGFWKDVVEKRPELESQWKAIHDERTEFLYPASKIMAELTEEDKLVYAHLGDRVPLSFQDQTLPQVRDFLQEFTEVDFMLLDRDALQLTSVTLNVDTTLEKALILITEQTGTEWKVADGMIKIGLPESLREYVYRVYHIRDLLLSVTDVGGGGGGAAGGAGAGGAGGAGAGAGGAGGVGLGFQFVAAEQEEGTAAQFGAGGAATTAGGVGGGAGGFGGAGGAAGQGGAGGGLGGTPQGNLLVLFIKQTCGYEENAWMNPMGGSDLGAMPMQLAGGPGGFGAAGGAGGFGAGGAGGAGGFGAAGGAGGFGPAGGAGGFGQAGLPGVGLAAALIPQGRAYFFPEDPGQLVIVQTEEIHDCIEGLLRELRGAMKIQVQVDMRFLSVATDFLRQIGFDWPTAQFGGTYDMDGNLDGLGLSSPAYGGFVPWLYPQTAGGALPLTGLPWGLGRSTGVPESTADDADLGVVTFVKAPLTGAPFMGTGLPFFGEPSSGLNLDFGFNAAGIAIAGEFSMAHERDAVRTLSSPRIVLSNGQAGFITVSTSYDYVSSFSVDEGLLIPDVGSVSESVDLRVRPVVSADRRYVFLELQPQIQTVALDTEGASFQVWMGEAGGEGGAAGSLVENFITMTRQTTQSLATTVGVPDRGLLIVGGLTTITREHHEGGIPILDKIPIVKRLFSAEGRQIDRDTLFVIARPEIIILGEREQIMR